MQRTSSTPVLLGRLWDRADSAGTTKKPAAIRRQPSLGSLGRETGRRPLVQLPAIATSNRSVCADPAADASRATPSTQSSVSDDRTASDFLNMMGPPVIGLRRSRTDESQTSGGGGKIGDRLRKAKQHLHSSGGETSRHVPRNRSVAFIGSRMSPSGEAVQDFENLEVQAPQTPTDTPQRTNRRRRHVRTLTSVPSGRPCDLSAESEQATSPCTSARSSSLASRTSTVRSSYPSGPVDGEGYSGKRGSSAELGWTTGERLGAGSYGTVHKAMDAKRGFIFAVKKGLIDENDEEGRKYRDKLEEELNICKHLRHPHIVSYLGYAYLDGFLHICLEYVPGGSLSTMLQEFGVVEQPLLQKASRGLVEGLDYLHTRKPPIVHRDIKGANVLVDLNFTVKLADFGCSKRCDCTKSFSTIGSIPWMAPEVIMQQDGHGRKADIWSLGCTIIEMATAEKPWGNELFGKNVLFALNHIGRSGNVPPVPEAIPASAQAFVRWCVQRDPKERPTTADLLEHEFLAGSA